MKRAYINPEMLVVRLQQHTSLLAGSIESNGLFDPDITGGGEPPRAPYIDFDDEKLITSEDEL